MNTAFLTDDEKQNAEINFPYKLNNKKPGTLAHGFYPVIQHCLAIFILTMRDGQTRK